MTQIDYESREACLGLDAQRSVDNVSKLEVGHPVPGVARQSITIGKRIANIGVHARALPCHGDTLLFGHLCLVVFNLLFQYSTYDR